ncbi:protein SERAC1-like isoform X2 [Homarus americanus]|uniref:protein SERAC1-like isoform X2 n=1 Tax=Homarus americanus TaxID=6706 RepID=UPI001C47F1AE|nr:protein SERAC1-like isoform X2 [Homarus americanus]
MSHILSRVVSKLGFATTFLLGAAVGNQVRNHRCQVPLISEGGSTVELRQEYADEWFIEEKRSSIIGKIYGHLQALSVTTSPPNSLTRSFTHIGKAMCQHYLQCRGLLKNSSEHWLQDWVNEADWIDTVDFWTRLPSLETFHSPTYSATLFAGVRALWYMSYSADFNKENYFLDADLAVTLKEVVEEKDDYATPLTLKIIANVIAMQKNLHLLHETGLLDTLTHCANNKESHIFLPAWRGLHNLKLINNKGSGHGDLYLEGVYPFVLPDEEKSPVVDIILVHGIKGGAAWTWRQHDKGKHKPLLSQEKRKEILSGKHIDGIDDFYTCCWPLDWLVPTLNMPVRVIAVNYRCGWWKWETDCPVESRGKSITNHSRDLAYALKVAGVGKRPIIWISHSMGGLLVKNMLLMDLQSKASVEDKALAEGHSKEKISSQANDGEWVIKNSLARQTVATIFFSVPHHGSPLATSVTQGMLRQLLRPTTELFDMRTDNPVLHHLHQSFVSLMKARDIAVLTLNESEPVKHKTTGYPLHFVPSEYGDPGVGVFHEVNATHLDICKPLNRKADSYCKVVSFLQAALSKL